MLHNICKHNIDEWLTLLPQMLMKRLWYMFSTLPVSNLSLSSSSDSSHEDIPARPRRPTRSGVEVIVMDMSVATLLLDGALLSDNDKADQLVYCNKKMKVAVEQRGSIMSFPPCKHSISIFEWVRKNYGQFRIAITSSQCWTLEHTCCNFRTQNVLNAIPYTRKFSLVQLFVYLAEKPTELFFDFIC